MTTNAIIMMAIALIIIWGGLLLSIIRLPKEYLIRLKTASQPRDFYVSSTEVPFLFDFIK